MQKQSQERSQTSTRRDAVVERLRNEIITGALRHGEILKDAELASRLGLSITPHIGGFFKDPGHQIVCILIMAVERGPVDHGPFGNITHRDGLEPFLSNQFNHRFLQEAMGAPDAQVGLFGVRHIFLIVA